MFLLDFKDCFFRSRFFSNGGADNEQDGINSPNPFSSPIQDYGCKSSSDGLANPFACPEGGGYVYDSVVNPFADMVAQVSMSTTISIGQMYPES